MDWHFRGNCSIDPEASTNAAAAAADTPIVLLPSFFNFPIACGYDFLRCSCVWGSTWRYAVYVCMLYFLFVSVAELFRIATRGVSRGIIYALTLGYCCGCARARCSEREPLLAARP